MVIITIFFFYPLKDLQTHSMANYNSNYKTPSKEKYAQKLNILNARIWQKI